MEKARQTLPHLSINSLAVTKCLLGFLLCDNHTPRTHRLLPLSKAHSRVKERDKETKHKCVKCYWTV